MAEQDSDPLMGDEETIVVSRKRRSSSAATTHSRSNSQSSIIRNHGISTPPETPTRTKKRVRFSDPGPAVQTESASSGLTPFIRRTSLLSTPPSKRRPSAPSTLWNRAEYDPPLSETVQFGGLRQVLDGRVKRRIRRNGLSEELNMIEWEKRQEAKSRRSEVKRLRAALAVALAEIQRMRDEQDLARQIGVESGTSVNTNTTPSTKIRELEQTILDLRAQLRQKDTDAEEDPNWTIAANGHFNFENDDDDQMITNYDHDFGESTMNNEVMTTPSRLNTSFPSPPSTTPNTPCKSASSTNAGVQASLPISDPENEALKSQLHSFETEISKLTAAVEVNGDIHTRLSEKLSEFLPIGDAHDHSTLDSALDAVLTQLALNQSLALEKSNAFSALSTEITTLGFTSCTGPEETLEKIAQQFRQARLHLEYLTPGEVVEGFENEKLLDMLLSRIRVLLQKVHEQDDRIDQYHEQELLLRQQLNTVVDAMRDMQQELHLASSVVGDLRTEIGEKEAGNGKLQRALDGYRDEVKGLEKLIEKMDKAGAESENRLRSEVNEVQERLQDEALKHDTTRADCEGKEMLIMELERRLNAALQAAADVEKEMAALTLNHNAEIAEKDTAIEQLKNASSEREKAHGRALALRDARVEELRREIERVNEAMKAAHSTILDLRKENKELEAQVEGEKKRGLVIVQSMLDQQRRMEQTGMAYLNGDVAVQTPSRESSRRSVDIDENAIVGQEPAVRRGGLFDGDLARRKKKKRMSYDSGLGFLEEVDEVDIGVEA